MIKCASSSHTLKPLERSKTKRIVASIFFAILSLAIIESQVLFQFNSEMALISMVFYSIDTPFLFGVFNVALSISLVLYAVLALASFSPNQKLTLQRTDILTYVRFS